MTWLEFENLAIEFFGLDNRAVMFKRDGLPKHMVQLLRQIAGLAHTVSFGGRRAKSSMNVGRVPAHSVVRNTARNQRRRNQRLSPKSPTSNRHRQTVRSRLRTTA